MLPQSAFQYYTSNPGIYSVVVYKKARWSKELEAWMAARVVAGNVLESEHTNADGAYWHAGFLNQGLAAQSAPAAPPPKATPKFKKVDTAADPVLKTFSEEPSASMLKKFRDTASDEDPSSDKN